MYTTNPCFHTKTLCAWQCWVLSKYTIAGHVLAGAPHCTRLLQGTLHRPATSNPWVSGDQEMQLHMLSDFALHYSRVTLLIACKTFHTACSGRVLSLEQRADAFLFEAEQKMETSLSF
jgi:hypothetical protein